MSDTPEVYDDLATHRDEIEAAVEAAEKAYKALVKPARDRWNLKPSAENLAAIHRLSDAHAQTLREIYARYRR